jgi:outer membrane protein assembly factor BamD
MIRVAPEFDSATRLRRPSTLTGALAAAIVALSLGGCSTIENLNPFGGERYETKILPDEPAQQIYDQALVRLQRKDFEGAARRFGDLEKQFPFSQWSRKGLLMVAYANYEGQKWDEAVTAGNRYISLYPSTEETPYALYLIGMSMYNQIPDISRDQDRAEQAVKVFNDLIQKFPKSEYAEEAKYKLTVARDQLAGKEMSVGRFYLSRKNYTAAVNRFREVLFKYQTTRHAEEALYRLTEAYLALGITHEAQTAAAVLGHNFPDSQWYKDAYSLLEKGGVRPQVSQGSWIARIFRGATGQG